jgi:hypothetical protein
MKISVLYKEFSYARTSFSLPTLLVSSIMKLSVLFRGAVAFITVLGAPHSRSSEVVTLNKAVTQSDSTNFGTIPSRAVHTLNRNRAGAVLLRPPEGEAAFGSVTGTFTVPTAKKGTSNGTYEVSIWVGIAASKEQDIVLRGGVTIAMTGTTAIYRPWYGFIPGKPIEIDAGIFSVKAGDSLTMTISTTSTTGGLVVIDNTTSGKKFTQSVAAPTSVNLESVTAQAVDWFVENTQVVGDLPLVMGYGKLQFSACSATTVSGKLVNLEGAGVYDAQTTSGLALTTTIITANGILVSQN